MATISSRLDDVTKELGNRSDITSGSPSRVALWYRNSYISVAMGYNFEQLENMYTFAATQQFSLPFPAQSRAITYLTIYDQNGSPSSPVFRDKASLDKAGDYAGVTSQQMKPGKPGQYTLYQQNLLFSPPFDGQNYTVVLNTWEKPIITADVVSTVLNVPDDWLEALDYGAMMRGHAVLGEPDKALALQRLLYGFTEPTTGRYVPGLFSNLMTRKQANAPARDYGLQPKSARYQYTR